MRQKKRNEKPKKVKNLEKILAKEVYTWIQEYDQFLVKLFNEITDENDPNRCETFFNRLMEYARTTNKK